MTEDMIDYYEELSKLNARYERRKFSKEMSAEDITDELLRLDSTYNNEAHEDISADEDKKISGYIEKAKIIFATEESKREYDEKLEASKIIPPPEDPDAKRRQELQEKIDQARDFYKKGDFELARTAVDGAISNGGGEVDPDLRSLAADIYMELENFNTAHEHIKLAILSQPEKPLYYVQRAMICERKALSIWEREPDKAREQIQSEREFCLQAVDIAGTDDPVERGRALGVLAVSLYFFEPQDEEQAEEYAIEAEELGDPWGNAQKVLDDLWNRRDAVYNQAMPLAASNDPAELDRAAELFRSIIDHRDAREQMQMALAKKKQILHNREQERLNGIYNRAMAMLEGDDPFLLGEAAQLFESVIDYLDSRQRRDQALEKKRRIENAREQARLENIYIRAMTMLAGEDLNQLDEAVRLFGSILDYKDSSLRRDQAIEKRRRIAEGIKGARRKKLFRRLSVLVIVVAAIGSLLAFGFWKAPGSSSRFETMLCYFIASDYANKGEYMTGFEGLELIEKNSMFYGPAQKKLYELAPKIAGEVLEEMEDEPPEDLEGIIELQDIMSRLPEDAPGQSDLDGKYSELADRFRNERLDPVKALADTGDTAGALARLKEIREEIEDLCTPKAPRYQPGSVLSEIFDMYYTYSDPAVDSFEDALFWHVDGRVGKESDTVADNQGNSYTGVYTQAPWLHGGIRDARWDSTGEFPCGRISGTLIRLSNDQSGKAYLKIMSGDRELYRVTIARGQEPVDFEYDLEGVEDCLVVFHGMSDDDRSMAGIANLRIYKKDS